MVQYGGLGIGYRSNNKGEQKFQKTTHQFNRPKCEDENKECKKWAGFGFCSDEEKDVMTLMATKCCRSCTDLGEVSGKLVELRSRRIKAQRTVAYKAVHREATQWKKK